MTSSSPRLPLISKLLYLLTALSGGLYLAFVLSPAFADGFNRTVASFGRALLGTLTAWIPFSLGELFVILLLPAAVLLIVVAVRRYTATWRATWVYLGTLGSAVCVILILFVWSFAAGYYAPTLDQKLNLERREVSAAELRETADILVAELDALHEEILYLEDGSSAMLMTYDEMNEKLMEAYRRAGEKYDFIDTFSSRVKPVMLSVPMSYTHITGVYTFFTGEANINVNFPDYTIPYTAAHELAHQRGVAREDEANFVAFLVCMESDDPYIRYSAYLNLYEYVASALYSADPEAYALVRASLPEEIRAEQAAYTLFFNQYRNNPIASISQATNDTYLKTQGATSGTRSYNMVVDLAVAYYRDGGAENH